MKQLLELRNRLETSVQTLRAKIALLQHQLGNQTKANTVTRNPSRLTQIRRFFREHEQPKSPTPPLRKASLFADGKTNVAALSLILHGVAEILSQKRDLPWNIKHKNNLSYEKTADGEAGTIYYYVTNDLDNLSPETLSEEAALVVIDRFDPRAGAIHLIYCAAAANLSKPWESEFCLDDKQLLEYTGLIKRRDLCRHQQLTILNDLVCQPAQVLAHIAWEKRQQVASFNNINDLKIWNVHVTRFDTNKAGSQKLAGLQVRVQPGVWAKYFLNKSEYYCYTGAITKKTIQTLFSIGKQNVGAARLLIWLTFQVKPGSNNHFSGKSLMAIAYGTAKLAAAQQNRQLRRQVADDFATDLKVIAAAGWQIRVATGPEWLTIDRNAKRPIGFWNQLLAAVWQFDLPEDAGNASEIVQLQKPPTGASIREARKAKGWSRAFFAEVMGKSVSWVDAIETEHRQVSQKDVARLIEKLDIKS